MVGPSYKELDGPKIGENLDCFWSQNGISNEMRNLIIRVQFLPKSFWVWHAWRRCEESLKLFVNRRSGNSQNSNQGIQRIPSLEPRQKCQRSALFVWPWERGKNKHQALHFAMLCKIVPKVQFLPKSFWVWHAWRRYEESLRLFVNHRSGNSQNSNQGIQRIPSLEPRQKCQRSALFVWPWERGKNKHQALHFAMLCKIVPKVQFLPLHSVYMLQIVIAKLDATSIYTNIFHNRRE